MFTLGLGLKMRRFAMSMVSWSFIPRLLSNQNIIILRSSRYASEQEMQIKRPRYEVQFEFLERIGRGVELVPPFWHPTILCTIQQFSEREHTGDQSITGDQLIHGNTLNNFQSSSDGFKECKSNFTSTLLCFSLISCYRKECNICETINFCSEHIFKTTF